MSYCCQMIAVVVEVKVVQIVAEVDREKAKRPQSKVPVDYTVIKVVEVEAVEIDEALKPLYCFAAELVRYDEVVVDANNLVAVECDCVVAAVD
jgi:hypothetical protein